MTSERWERTKQILEDVLKLAPEKHAEFLDSACNGDTALRSEVESLIASHEEAGSQFLTTAAPEALGLTPPLSAVRFHAGQSVGLYKILDEIGHGGMGVVYKAEDLKLGRRVAIKFLPGDLVADSQAFERLEREARAASALDHRNICSIYQLGEHEGQPFIVMQLLEGQTLREWIQVSVHKPIEARVREIVDFSQQITAGLEAAHEKGILHRDIKPANIFVTNRGEVKILDFGLAKIVEGDFANNPAGDKVALSEPSPATAPTAALPDLRLSRTGTTMGTASYMSPEQVRGEKLDSRTDLFSFGLVLYEMATGQCAFPGHAATVICDDILHKNAVPTRQLNPQIPSELGQIISKALEKDRGLRYQSASEMRADLQRLNHVHGSGQPIRAASRWDMWRILVPAVAVVVAGLIGGILRYRFQAARRLTERDAIVLSDFANSTGDPIFDDTLKQGLSVHLAQSPFLQLISERKVNGTLKRMGRPAEDRLTPEVAREVCQRTVSKAMVNGSIASLGSQYVVGLKAVNCDTGDVLAETQERAAGKEAVLKALDAAAVSLRSQLGESIGSVRKYATPLEDATTPSLEALKAYSLGKKTNSVKGETAALPMFRLAAELDPNFAMAYTAMAVIYADLNQPGRAAEYARKAYGLREKVSARERLGIETTYYLNTTGELEKAAQVYELWQQIYPRDVAPYANLGMVFDTLGNYERLLEENREALRLEPNLETSYANLGNSYVALNRLDEAEAVYREAEQRKLGGEFLLQNRYSLAFLKNDTLQMAQLVAAVMGKPGAEDMLLTSHADTNAWHGKLKDARDLTQRAMESAKSNDAKETAAGYQAEAALREAETGNREQARADAKAAVKLAPNRDVKATASLSLARAGDTAVAEELATELDQTFPLDTVVQRYWLPAIRAEVALQHRNPNRAIELLEAARATELGQLPLVGGCLCPAYLRGEAYLRLHDGSQAAAEYQKFIDHRGVVGNFQWGALARLGLARAYAMQGDTVKSRATYQDFLTLWKEADLDVPILKRAKAEYAKLQ